MFKEKKMVFVTIFIIGIVILISIVFSFTKLYQNYLKKDSGTLYIVIKQYEVVNGHFETFEGIVLFEAPFTDDLYYKEKIETKYGYNTILIENGIASVIDANCPNPHSLNGCMNKVITNDENFLDIAVIRCMQHGISISWEVR